MDYSQAAAEFHKLKARYDAGTLTEADFKARLEELMVQDEQGRWWMIGYETGQWYVHDGEKWVRAEPPAPQDQLIVATALPEIPAIVRTEPEKVVPGPPARPPWPWLRIGGAIVAVAVVIAVIAQLAGRPQPTPTPTLMPPTATLVPRTLTLRPPTATLAPPTTTPVPPTKTSALPTATLRPPTATPMPPTATPAPPTVTATATPGPAFTVKEPNVNVRGGPDTAHLVIGTLRQGETFKITGRNQAGDWWQFDFNGKPAWVSNSVVNANSQAAGAPVVAAPPTPKPSLGIGSIMVSDKDNMTLVYVPAGEFTMGPADGDSDAASDEKPQHKVSLDAYWIDRTEVTNAQYRQCVAAGACQPPSASNSKTRASYYGNAEYGSYPVLYVSWVAAQKYCQWAGRRLPTEAEWEKAARGTDGRKYPWGDQNVAGDLLNFCDRTCTFGWKDNSIDDGYADTAPVNSYPKGASPYGALDMAGNAWEWVADWYDAIYYRNAPAQNPQGPTGGIYHVLRGGSWGYIQEVVRAANRDRGGPDLVNDDVGFRCAHSP